MSFFKIFLKNSIVYRWTIVFSIMGSLMFIAINIMLWRFLYRDTPEMISYSNSKSNALLRAGLGKAAMLRIARRDIVSRIPILSQIKASLTQKWNNS
ncbi:MAG: hypothetical protein LBT08_00790 [Synergistaceae bacterium]|jgi:hypothetical protein|nr:hypothetical protein [Synergistaceae bacterium]